MWQVSFSKRAARNVAEVLELYEQIAQLQQDCRELPAPANGGRHRWQKELDCRRERLRKTSRELKRAARVAMRLAA